MTHVSLTTVSVKLPTCSTDSPEVYKLKLSSRITLSRTRFTHFDAVLPQYSACRLLDLVRAPPAEPYEALSLIQMYSLSEFQGYQAL